MRGPTGAAATIVVDELNLGKDGESVGLHFSDRTTVDWFEK